MSDQTVAAKRPPKKQIADHVLLDAAGNAVDEMDSAYGIRYTDIASKLTTQYIPKNADALRMLAVFGAKTRATNVASQVRQKDGSAADEIAAIDETFKYMEDGNGWLDSTREPGPRWDPAIVAQASVNVSVAKGKLPTAEDQQKALKKLIEKQTDDEAGKAVSLKLRAVPGVVEEYQRLAGKPMGSVDDITAMLADDEE